MSSKNEQFNKNKGVDVLEEEISKEGVSENKKEGINTDQDPSLGGILTEKEIIQNRKYLAELVDEASKVRMEINYDKTDKNNNKKEERIKEIKKEIEEKKKEIDEIIDNKKE